jgi:hypothetical protein
LQPNGLTNEHVLLINSRIGLKSKKSKAYLTVFINRFLSFLCNITYVASAKNNFSCPKIKVRELYSCLSNELPLKHTVK